MKDIKEEVVGSNHLALFNTESDLLGHFPPVEFNKNDLFCGEVSVSTLQRAFIIYPAIKLYRVCPLDKQ